MENWAPKEPWKQLYESNNVKAELDKIYTADFFIEFATRFNRDPHPYDLLKGVYDTAEAYLAGKREYAVHKSELYKHSGIHLRRAGIAARTLQYSLQQLSKSDFAETLLHKNLGEHLRNHSVRGRDAYNSAVFRNGPSHPLAFLQELSAALALAINDIKTLPEKDEEGEDKYAKHRAMAFVRELNANRNATFKKVPINHALETAARIFRPTWEQYSKVKFVRGRYYHERGGYDSKPAQALHRIISKIDNRVPESLVGTAIENIRQQSKSV